MISDSHNFSGEINQYVTEVGHPEDSHFVELNSDSASDDYLKDEYDHTYNEDTEGSETKGSDSYTDSEDGGVSDAEHMSEEDEVNFEVEMSQLRRTSRVLPIVGKPIHYKESKLIDHRKHTATRERAVGKQYMGSSNTNMACEVVPQDSVTFYDDGRSLLTQPRAIAHHKSLTKPPSRMSSFGSTMVGHIKDEEKRMKAFGMLKTGVKYAKTFHEEVEAAKPPPPKIKFMRLVKKGNPGQNTAKAVVKVAIRRMAS